MQAFSMPDDKFRFFRNHAPHYRQAGAAYFITFRLASNQFDLAPAERDLVADSLNHFHPDRYYLFCWVVMNDHVHALFLPREKEDVSKIMHSWKSYTANRLQRQHGRAGSVWQKDSFDRVIFSDREFNEKAHYIVNNPLKRWPDLNSVDEYHWVGWNSF